MTISPATSMIYVTLQNSDGSGNSAFSYALAVSSTSCTSSSGNDNCSYTVQLPIGADVVEVLTTNAANAPLDYSQPVNFTVTAAGPNTLGLALSPIIARAVPAYAFQQFNGSTGYYPLVSLSSVTDAAGDAIANAGEYPNGYPYSQINVSQTAGTFDFIEAGDVGRGSYLVAAGPLAAGTSTPLVLAAHGSYVVELGNGTTSSFTTVVTVATPAVQFTTVQFPSLPSTATVPASSNSISLTCQIPTSPISSNGGAGGLASDPCPAAVPLGLTVG
jgi:hypothetical protein